MAQSKQLIYSLKIVDLSIANVSLPEGTIHDYPSLEDHIILCLSMIFHNFTSPYTLYSPWFSQDLEYVSGLPLHPSSTTPVGTTAPISAVAWLPDSSSDVNSSLAYFDLASTSGIDQSTLMPLGSKDDSSYHESSWFYGMKIMLEISYHMMLSSSFHIYEDIYGRVDHLLYMQL